MRKLAVYAVVALMGSLGVWWAQTGGFAASPQQLSLSLGRSQPAAMGRARVTLMEAGDVYSDDAIREAAQVQVLCSSDRRKLSVTMAEPAEEVCGIRLKLISLSIESSPKAVVEITW